jgi:hypothetical protein
MNLIDFQIPASMARVARAMLRRPTALRALLAAALLVLPVAFVACQTYIAPADPQLLENTTGALRYAGDPVDITFSKMIDPTTLVFNVYSGSTEAGNYTKVLADCRLGAATEAVCGTTKLTYVAMSEYATVDATGQPVTNLRPLLTVQFDAADVGKPGVPLTLEIADGLKGYDGHPRTYPWQGSVQFFPKIPGGGDDDDDATDTSGPGDDDDTGGTGDTGDDDDTGGSDTGPVIDPIDFDDGVFIISGTVKIGTFTTYLRLITDIKVTPDGRAALVATMGTYDQAGGAARDTNIPEEITVNTGPTGFTIFSEGTLTDQNGTRFLVTNKTDASVQAAVGIRVNLYGLQINASVAKNPATGKDRLEGTIAYQKLEIIVGSGEPTKVNTPGNEAFKPADWITPARVPQTPAQSCVETTCGDVIPANCTVSTPNWPSGKFCTDWKAANP